VIHKLAADVAGIVKAGRSSEQSDFTETGELVCDQLPSEYRFLRSMSRIKRNFLKVEIGKFAVMREIASSFV